MWTAIRSFLIRTFEAPPEDSGVTIVALLANKRDRDTLLQIAARKRWTVHFRDTCGEAWQLLQQHQIPIVLCDRELPGTEWRDVIHMMVSPPHFVYAILVSRVVDDYLWNEVIRHGGHDLLATPFLEEELLRTIRLARSYIACMTTQSHPCEPHKESTPRNYAG